MNLRFGLTFLSLSVVSATLVGSDRLSSNNAPTNDRAYATTAESKHPARKRANFQMIFREDFRQVISLQNRGSKASELIERGMTEYKSQRFQSAIELWKQALQLFRADKHRLGTIETLGLLLTGYMAIGDDLQMLTAAQELQQIATNDGDRAKALGYMGFAQRNLGNYAKSLELQQQSLAIFQRLKDTPSTGQVLNNLGNTYATLGDYDRAKSSFDNSLKIAKQTKDPRSIASVLANLGALSTDAGKDNQALGFYQESLKITQSAAVKDPTLETGILINLGSTYNFLDRYNLGMKYYLQGLTLAKKIKNSPLQGMVLTNMGLVYEDRRNYGESIRAHQQSIAIAQATKDPRTEAKARNNYAHVLLAAKKLGEAETQLNTTIQLLDRTRTQLSDLQQINIFDTQVSSYNLLQQVLIANNKPETALEALEKGRARAFAQLLSTRFSDSAKVQTAKTQNLETPSIDRIRQIAKEQNATLVSYGIVPDEAFKFRGKQRGREAELFVWVVQPTGKVTFRRVDLKPLWKLNLTLPDLVKVGICLDTASTCPTVEQFARQKQQQGNNPPLAPLSPQDRRALPTGKYPGLRELYQLLIAPIADVLPTNPEAEVVFIPQDSLLVVPFAALQAPDGKFLIQKHTIRTAPSIQVLSLTRQQRQRQSRSNLSAVVVVGNPTMPSISLKPGASRQKLAPLPESEKEAKQIAKLFKSEAIVGSKATKANILEKFKRSKLIHLATHGLLEYNSRTGGVQRELPGAIALAPTDRDDGLLTASEIFDLNLNASLVVLSACDTGSGRVTGDGVVVIAGLVGCGGAECDRLPPGSTRRTNGGFDGCFLSKLAKTTQRSHRAAPRHPIDPAGISQS
jgi:CHAT domain-containing protein/Tfp pilus assembly protein PilF